MENPNLKARGETFAKNIGLVLRGKIVQHGYDIKTIAPLAGHAPSVISNWLNPKRSPIPLSALANICEIVGEKPQDVVAEAHKMGERQS
jgi:hypothetical protein